MVGTFVSTIILSLHDLAINGSFYYRMISPIGTGRSLSVKSVFRSEIIRLRLLFTRICAEPPPSKFTPFTMPSSAQIRAMYHLPCVGVCFDFLEYLILYNKHIVSVR